MIMTLNHRVIQLVKSNINATFIVISIDDISFCILWLGIDPGDSVVIMINRIVLGL